jgi:hypothetical protein
MEAFELGIGIIIGATITYLFMKGTIKEADEIISRLNKRIKQLENESKIY